MFSLAQFVNLYFLADEAAFRNLVLWIEDQKIRHYTIEDRTALRSISSNEWPKAFQQVFASVS